MMATLQTDQLEQLKDIFTRFDMDSDGSLTQLELAALLRSLGLKPSGDQLHVLLSDMDSNANGLVEFDELVHAILPDMSEEVLINQEQLSQVFRSFDRDGNGYITAAELAGSMAKMGHPLTYRELSEMMREADTNGDGVISFNEFATIMARGFPIYGTASIQSCNLTRYAFRRKDIPYMVIYSGAVSDSQQVYTYSPDFLTVSGQVLTAHITA
ncbi:hypothetical protein Dsin_009706 [Dipteronia sinensis]|uniref:EF-hand domain-containing protein n=1 Tax=Dipteronia sinensis TaxID=43782 RepID=A0AAE0EBZ7_9ROSI|nr:hypothetical protein Dsin_009706 [Dipteronia sinensis]